MYRPSELARQPVHPVLWAMALSMVLFEVLFWAVDQGWVTPALSRYRIYAVFAFWDPYFEIARTTGQVPAQLVWSFVTHAFLHGDWLHLGMNVAAFLGLGHAVSRAAGIGPTLALFVVTASAGALTFGLLTDFPGPLVGASGAIFGYLAVLTAWQERMLRTMRLPRTEIWQRILGLIILNAALDFGLGGMLAWEAHLGGFVAGWAMAGLYPPRLLRPAQT